MTKSELKIKYLDWMYRLVNDKYYTEGASYSALFRFLNSAEFTYTIEMDENRAYDGVCLRYQFGFERGISVKTIERYLDDTPCSVLEMIAALSLKCEEHIMDDASYGNRTGKWFWGIMRNLGLVKMSDDRFDEKYAEFVIRRLLNREYKRNGEGGLFTIENCAADLRDVEIWYQMCWHLNDILT
jgi:hypothetical protein